VHAGQFAPVCHFAQADAGQRPELAVDRVVRTAAALASGLARGPGELRLGRWLLLTSAFLAALLKHVGFPLRRLSMGKESTGQQGQRQAEVRGPRLHPLPALRPSARGLPQVRPLLASACAKWHTGANCPACTRAPGEPDAPWSVPTLNRTRARTPPESVPSFASTVVASRHNGLVGCGQDDPGIGPLAARDDRGAVPPAARGCRARDRGCARPRDRL